jgi:hypothetical protein
MFRLDRWGSSSKPVRAMFKTALILRFHFASGPSVTLWIGPRLVVTARYELSEHVIIRLAAVSYYELGTATLHSEPTYVMAATLQGRSSRQDGVAGGTSASPACSVKEGQDEKPHEAGCEQEGSQSAVLLGGLCPCCAQTRLMAEYQTDSQ